MTNMSDAELDLAIAEAKEEWQRLSRERQYRRLSAKYKAHPEKVARTLSPEGRARISAANKGRKRSAAEKAAIARGMAKYWADKKKTVNLWTL